MLPSLLRRAAQQNTPYNIHLNPYKAQRLWPPDFSQMNSKQQFRLERKFKRRAKLKWARPRWTKFTKILQMSAISFTLVYGVLFMDWSTLHGRNSDHPPFQSIRQWFFGMTGSIWTNDQVRKGERTKSSVDDASQVNTRS